MTNRFMVVLSIASCVASCGDDSGSTGDAGKDAGPVPVAMDAGMDAFVDPFAPPKTFSCPMSGGSSALECTVPELNIGFLKDAGITMLGPLPIDLAGTLVMPQGCCTDDGKCGASVPMFGPPDTCLEQHQPGDQDGQCPDEVLTLDADTKIPLPGCCKPSNECGLDLGPLGLGCGERGFLISLVPGVGGSLPDGGLQGSLPCNYGHPGDDGGSDDAGN